MALEDYRADAMRCTRCAYCKWIPFDLIKSARFAKGCPSIESGKFHSYSAGGRLVTALSLMDGRSTVTEKVKDSVFKCNLCGQCDVSCKICRYDMEPLEAMRELRATLVKEGHTLAAAGSGHRRACGPQFNMLRQPAEKPRRLGEGAEGQGSDQGAGRSTSSMPDAATRSTAIWATWRGPA